MRRVGRVILVSLLICALAAAAAVTWRKPLAEAALTALLARQGIEGVEARVTALGLRAAVLGPVRLAGGAIGARRVTLAYSPAALAGGRIDSVTVAGLDIDMRAAPGLRMPAPGAGDGGPGLLPARVGIADATIRLAAPFPATLSLDGEIALDGPAPRAELSAALSADWVAARAEITGGPGTDGLALALDGSAEIDLARLPAAAERGLSGALSLSAAGDAMLPLPGGPGGPDGGWAPPLRLDLAGQARALGLAAAPGPETLDGRAEWRLGGGFGPEAEGLSLTLDAPARLAVAGLRPALAALGGSGAATVTLAPGRDGAALLTWRPGGAQGDSGGEGGDGAARLDARAELASGTAAAATRLVAEVVLDPAGQPRGPLALAAEIDARSVTAGLPGLAGRVERLAATLDGTRRPDGSLDLTGPARAVIDAPRAGGLAAERLTLEGNATLAAGADGALALSLAPGATAAGEGFAWPGLARVTAPATLTLDDARLMLDGAAAPPRLDLALTADALDIEVLRADATPLLLSGAGGRVTLGLAVGDAPTGTVTLAEGRAALEPASGGPRLSDVALVLPLGDGPLRLSARIADGAAPARHAPAELAAEGRRAGDMLSLAGTLTARPISGAPGPALPAAATADLATGRASLRVGPGTLSFAAGGLRPADLAPALAALGTAEGAVEVTLEARLAPGAAVETSGLVTLAGLDLDTGDIALDGVSGALALARLWPLESDGPQVLSADSALAGLPLSAPWVEFTLLPGPDGGPRIVIARAAAGAAGGRVSTRRATWDIGAERNGLALSVQGIDVATLLEEWRVEGVSGSGQLSGTVPLTVSPAGVNLDGGRLDAAGPGVIRVDWGNARERMMASGEQVALAVTALEDFRYTTMSIGIGQSRGGELSLAIGLEGANPAVLEGYPFRFNVTLSGRIDPILDAIAEGRRLGGEMFWGGLGGR